MYLIIGTTVSLLRLPRSKKLLLSRLRHNELLFRFRIRVCKSVVGQYVYNFTYLYVFCYVRTLGVLSYSIHMKDETGHGFARGSVALSGACT